MTQIFKMTNINYTNSKFPIRSSLSLGFNFDNWVRWLYMARDPPQVRKVSQDLNLETTQVQGKSTRCDHRPSLVGLKGSS
jgi:hypothetical protein